MNRRAFLGSAAAVTAVAPGLPGWLSGALAQDRGLRLGEPRPFSFDSLIEDARVRASRDYAAPVRPAPEIVSKLGYAEHGELRFKPDYALYADGPAVYPVTFFHLGRFFPKGVKMKVVDGGEAREIVYMPDYFEMPEDSVARKLPADVGFAGFRFQESRARDDWKTQDWVAFLGASYFRSIGALNQYGISARGIAVDTAEPGGEEFPDFVEFYIEGARTETGACRVHALLDGPRIAGAFAFEIWRTSGAVMRVDARLFPRAPIARLGVAPLTSMFWYGKHNRPYKVDWRPQVHDSDGLEIWSGSGERIWRALNNPRRVVISSFVDRNPKGFGLMQRDRDVENYLDGVNYDLRPSLWVEPLHDWGEGAVQLVEIPTNDEIHDNIVAFWVPKAPVKGGEELQFRYRLHWLADNPYPPDLARVTATRLGRGGRPGLARPEGVTKFVVEFAGGPLDGLTDRAVPDAEISPSRGEISLDFVERVPRTERWRVTFDLAVENDEKPVELRMFLRQGRRPLSETWTYQYWPRTGP